jgi:transcriptional regulator with XRE-family HTH domain
MVMALTMEYTAGHKEGDPMSPPASVSTAHPFGVLLRQWRTARKMSQLALALEADISARHLSFLETGRAQPSRDMVLLLATSLDVPLRERNRWLLAAGYAPIYRETALTTSEMRPAQQALEFVLTQQEPYPALVMDHQWNLLRSNQGADRVFQLFLDSAHLYAASPPNIMRLTFDPRGLRPYIVNWDEVAGHMLHLLYREAVWGIPDEDTTHLLDTVLAFPRVPAHVHVSAPVTALAPLLFLELRKDDLTVKFFSTIATLGTPQDMTLQELRIECFFPGDATTEALMRRLAAASSPPVFRP